MKLKESHLPRVERVALNVGANQRQRDPPCVETVKEPLCGSGLGM